MSQLKSMIIVLLMLTSALVGCIGTDTTDLEQQITDLEQSKNQMNETIHNMEITLQERNTEIAILNSNVAMLQSLIKNAEAYRDSLLVLLENSNASNDELVLMIEDANYSILSLNSEIIQQNNQIRLWMAGCELRPLSEFINYSNTIPRSYTEMEIQYFSKIAMGSEFGGDGVIHKWNGNVTIQIHGSPSECDREYLDQTISELNRIQDGINLTIVSGDGDINLYFTTYASFELVESNYVYGNEGFFWCYWDTSGVINNANVFIRDDLADLYKNHLLKEELTQSLGLMNDADWFGDSIFFSYWSSTTDYAEIDKVLISMLYRNDIHSNMNSSEVLEILN
jgi:hypothetical protein